MEWTDARDELVQVLENLGFPKEIGNSIAKELGSPKAIRRMTAYLRQVRPRSMELIADEMIAICSEIAVWRDKKESLKANSAYNEMLYRGFEDE